MKRRGLVCKSPWLRSHEGAPAEEAHGTGQSSLWLNGLNVPFLALEKSEGSCCHGSKPGFNESAEAWPLRLFKSEELFVFTLLFHLTLTNLWTEMHTTFEWPVASHPSERKWAMTECKFSTTKSPFLSPDTRAPHGNENFQTMTSYLSVKRFPCICLTIPPSAKQQILQISLFSSWNSSSWWHLSHTSLSVH